MATFRKFEKKKTLWVAVSNIGLYKSFGSQAQRAGTGGTEQTPDQIDRECEI